MQTSLLQTLSYANYLAFVPTAIFMTTLQQHEAKFPDRWAYAFYYAFWPAVVLAIIALLTFARSEKLWLGTNIWFALLGSLTALKAWGPLEVVASTFKESGGFVTAAVLGIIACIVAPGSFVGARQSPRSCCYAWLLAIVACLVATLSFLSQGTRSLSVALPVVVFLASQYSLRRALRSRGEA